MDRLETIKKMKDKGISIDFIFQYGQIRNGCSISMPHFLTKIYIPVWIDQKQKTSGIFAYMLLNLHSSMDRLETLTII